MRKRTNRALDDTGNYTERTEEFLLCIGDKCAWWVKCLREYGELNAMTGYRQEVDEGHCVAHDWGKR